MTDAWQPIETAPRDGSFLVYMPDERREKIQVCYIRKVMNGTMSVIGSLFAWDRSKPTHWHPLPEPPASAKP